MLKLLILDLDGPILEGKFRHYACYSRILQQYGYTPLELDRYWQLKRERVASRQILAESGAEAVVKEFSFLWLELIELPGYLELDILQPGVITKLGEWQEQGLALFLATQRRNAQGLHVQLEHLELSRFFERILVCPHDQGGPGKAARVKQAALNYFPQQCLWIGDTEVDIEAAKEFGCPVWAVSCGLRTGEYLKALNPTFLSNTLQDIELI